MRRLDSTKEHGDKDIIKAIKRIIKIRRERRRPDGL
jgi:hypothetical protein